MSEPDVTDASTTTVACANPAMMRLRAGKLHRRTAHPGGISDTTHPAATMCWCSRRLLGGYGRCALPASTATVAPPPSSAPACAAESTPSAMPDTTVTPATASSRPSDRAASSP